MFLWLTNKIKVQNCNESVLSHFSGNRLDCFGVAYAVVAICQTLGFNDVHLALSEDHAWVVFGQTGTETAEVTWHGKGNEDKRGRPVDGSGDSGHSWLYLGGYPVKCTRHMEVASAVSSINSAINSTTDSVALAKLQQVDSCVNKHFWTMVYVKSPTFTSTKKHSALNIKFTKAHLNMKFQYKGSSGQFKMSFICQSTVHKTRAHN